MTSPNFTKHHIATTPDPSVSIIMAAHQAGPFIEGGPLPPLEAAACGVPVIATPAGILPEFVKSEHNGLLINGNFHELRSAVYRLLHEEELFARLKRNARNSASKWQWGAAAGAYADVLESFRRNTE